MRKVENSQMEIGEIAIGEIHIEAKSPDDIPVYSDKNEQLFQIVNFDEKYTDFDNLNTDSNQNER